MRGLRSQISYLCRHEQERSTNRQTKRSISVYTCKERATRRGRPERDSTRTTSRMRGANAPREESSSGGAGLFQDIAGEALRRPTAPSRRPNAEGRLQRVSPNVSAESELRAVYN